MNRLEETISAWPVNGLPARWPTERGACTTGWRRCTRFPPCSFIRARTAARWRPRDSRRHAGAGGGHRQRRDVPPPGARQSQRLHRRRGSFAQHGGAHAAHRAPQVSRPRRRTARPWTRATCRSATSPSTRSSAATCWNCFRPKISYGTVGEFRRVLRDRGRLTLVLIGQNTAMFNASTRCWARWRRRSGDGRWSSASRI